MAECLNITMASPSEILSSRILHALTRNLFYSDELFVLGLSLNM